jgi:hypothetical protein
MAFNGFTKLHPVTVVPVMLMKFIVRGRDERILAYVLCQNVYIKCGAEGGGGMEQITDHGVDYPISYFYLTFCPASPENRRPSATGLLNRTHSAALLSPICTCSKRPRAGNAP